MSSSNKKTTPQQAKESKSKPKPQPNADANSQTLKTPTPTPNFTDQAKKTLDSMTQGQQLEPFHRTRSLVRQAVADRKYNKTQDRFDAMQQEMLTATLARTQHDQIQQQLTRAQLARRSRPQPLRAQHAQIEAVAPEYFADVSGGGGGDADDTEDEIIMELEGMSVRDWVGR